MRYLTCNILKLECKRKKNLTPGWISHLTKRVLTYSQRIYKIQQILLIIRMSRNILLSIYSNTINIKYDWECRTLPWSQNWCSHTNHKFCAIVSYMDYSPDFPTHHYHKWLNWAQESRIISIHVMSAESL